jgi:hypothetical protein
LDAIPAIVTIVKIELWRTAAGRAMLGEIAGVSLQAVARFSNHR